MGDNEIVLRKGLYMKIHKNLVVFLNAFLFVNFISVGFAQEQISIPDSIKDMIQKVQYKYCPDKRISRFEVNAKLKDEKLILSGETLSAEGKAELLDRFKKKTTYQVVDSISVLPDQALGDDVYGIVRISVAQLRRNPDEIYEIVDQASMGSEVKLLKMKNKYWVYCQLDDEYIGWMTTSSLTIGDHNFVKQWRNQNRLVVTANYGQIWETPSLKSIRSVSDVVKGNRLINKGRKKGWYQVELPDGRVGFIQSNFVTTEDKFNNDTKFESVDKLLRTAYRFIGLPYLWGGRSTKAFDCSGFTQTVFKLNGIQLPRDANMQVKVGTEVPIDDSLKNLKPGDLVFFGRDIDHIYHVGIYIGGDQFIHSESSVQINSFNPNDENYSEFRRKGLRAIRRVVER